MKVHVLKCPECQATLDLEDGMKFIFCKYCGTKVYVDDQKFESTFNVNKTSFHTHRYVNEADVIRAKTESKSHRKELVGVLVGFALIAVFFLSSGTYFASEKRESNAEEERLQNLVEEVLVDIENGNYDVAYIKANSLYYTSGWSDDIENKWDSTREALLEKIEEAQAAAKDGAEDVNENSQDAEAVSDEKSLKDSVLDLFKE